MFDQATADRIYSAILAAWSGDLQSLTQMQLADLFNSVQVQYEKAGEESVTPEYLARLKRQLEQEWSGELDQALTAGVGTR